MEMAAVKEMQKNVYEILTNDSSEFDVKLRTLQNLKKQFKPSDKIFSRLKLDSLLQRARFSLENKAQDKKFLFSYATSLLSFVGRYGNLDLEILNQLEYILMELKRECENLVDILAANLWSHLESGSVFDRDGILIASKQIIERTVLDWMDTPEDPKVDFLSEMAADSPKLFQTVTSVLFELLVRTCFHTKVLEVQKLFLLSVKRVCLKKGKNFLGLYPKGCCQLVSLLRVPPKVHAKGKEHVISDVVSLLLEMFLLNKKRALILLTHYLEWVNVFKLNLKQIEV